MSQVTILPGDCREVLETLPGDFAHSVVTDPPYHLTSIVKRFGAKNAAPVKSEGATGVYRRASAGFMGKQWDGGDIAFDADTWRAIGRVLKPGGHLVAFGGTRTFHRMAVAIEDAGFELRDTLMWVYGQGFPKSHNQKGEWEGWGTALKPAWEPIILARKSFIGSVATNLAVHQTGALNIDGCRIEASGRRHLVSDPKPEANGAVYAGRIKAGSGFDGGSKAAGVTDVGRWPANLIHDGSDEVVESFPQSRGQQAAVGSQHGDAGSAARFFYCAKASRSDRDEGLDESPDGAAPAVGKNTHPTVKPTSLMRWLCRLVTPPGGLVLDPFAGSGSTGRGAVLDGFRFVGIEKEAEYVSIAARRIAACVSETENAVEALLA